MRRLFALLLFVLLVLFSPIRAAANAVTLDATNKTLEATTTTTASTDYVVSYVDGTATTFTPGTSQGNITTATTTTILAAPAASTQRAVVKITITNRGGVSQTVQLKLDVGGTEYAITPVVTLAAGESLSIDNVGSARRVSSTGEVIDVVVTNAPFVHMHDEIVTSNSTTTPLGSGGVFTGTSTSTSGHGTLSVFVFSNVSSAADGFSIQFSTDGTNWDEVWSTTFTSGSGSLVTQQPIRGEFFRVVYTNGGSAQATFRLESTLKASVPVGTVQDIRDALQAGDHAQIVKALVAGQTTGGGGGYVEVKVDPSGALSVAPHAVTQSGGPWTVTEGSGATIATNTGTIATNTGRIPVQGQAAMAASTPVVIASNQSAVPVTVTFEDTIGTTVPTAAAFVAGSDGTNTRAVRTDANGELQVDVLTVPTHAVTQSGGPWTVTEGSGATIATNTGRIPALGQTTMAGSQPVAIASNQSAVPISASSLPLPTGAATSAAQTDGTQKAIVRGGAKGATTAADVTSHPLDADHQPLDVILPDLQGNGTIDALDEAVTTQVAPGSGSVVFVLDATGWNGTIAFECDANGSNNWKPIPARQIDDSGENDWITQTTTSFYGRASAVGCHFIRARASAYVAGSMVAHVHAMAMSAFDLPASDGDPSSGMFVPVVRPLPHQSIYTPISVPENGTGTKVSVGDATNNAMRVNVVAGGAGGGRGSDPSLRRRILG